MNELCTSVSSRSSTRHLRLTWSGRRGGSNCTCGVACELCERSHPDRMRPAQNVGRVARGGAALRGFAPPQPPALRHPGCAYGECARGHGRGDLAGRELVLRRIVLGAQAWQDSCQHAPSPSPSFGWRPRPTPLASLACAVVPSRREDRPRPARGRGARRNGARTVVVGGVDLGDGIVKVGHGRLTARATGGAVSHAAAGALFHARGAGGPHSTCGTARWCGVSRAHVSRARVTHGRSAPGGTVTVLCARCSRRGKTRAGWAICDNGGAGTPSGTVSHGCAVCSLAQLLSTCSERISGASVCVSASQARSCLPCRRRRSRNRPCDDQETGDDAPVTAMGDDLFLSKMLFFSAQR